MSIARRAAHSSLFAISAAIAMVVTSVAHAQHTVKTDLPDNLVRQARVTETTARETALARVPRGTVQAVELEREDGHLQYSYDVKVPRRSGITEVNVDAMTGKVIGVDHEGASTEAAEVKAESRPSAGGGNYHVVNTYTLGGDGGWDYLALDPASHRLFITRGDRAMVVDPDNGKVLGEVTGIDGAHGVAFDDAAGHGFATSGRDSSVVMFDLKSLAVLGRAKAAADADAILFDPATKHVFTFNGDAQSSSVIDGATGRNVGTIDLGAKPEFGVSDGHGKVYVNLESTGEIAEIDAPKMRVIRKWSIAPCESPTGLAIDVAHDRLFSGCRNKVMAISDAKAGKLVTTVPIGSGVDACRFDAATGDAFSSNGGDGTITVMHEDAPDHYTVVQTVPTMRSARTMELNPATNALYTVGAKFGPMPAESAGTPPRRRRPPMIPGSFTLLVLQR